MKRRQALLAACSVLGAGGCLGIGQPTQARLAWIWLQNDRSELYDVSMVVEDDGETVFDESYTNGKEAETANVNVEDPVDGPGQYVVRATMTGETRAVKTPNFVQGNRERRRRPVLTARQRERRVLDEDDAAVLDSQESPGHSLRNECATV
jgi:hypothetical protein